MTHQPKPDASKQRRRKATTGGTKSSTSCFPRVCTSEKRKEGWKRLRCLFPTKIQSLPSVCSQPNSTCSFAVPDGRMSRNAHPSQQTDSQHQNATQKNSSKFTHQFDNDTSRISRTAGPIPTHVGTLHAQILLLRLRDGRGRGRGRTEHTREKFPHALRLKGPHRRAA